MTAQANDSIQINGFNYLAKGGSVRLGSSIEGVELNPEYDPRKLYSSDCWRGFVTSLVLKPNGRLYLKDVEGPKYKKLVQEDIFLAGFSGPIEVFIPGSPAYVKKLKFNSGVLSATQFGFYRTTRYELREFFPVDSVIRSDIKKSLDWAIASEGINYLYAAIFAFFLFFIIALKASLMYCSIVAILFTLLISIYKPNLKRTFANAWTGMAGHVPMQLILAEINMNGTGGEKDYRIALWWLSLAAEKHELAEANAMLGNFYNGLSGPDSKNFRDVELAIKYYRRANKFNKENKTLRNYLLNHDGGDYLANGKGYIPIGAPYLKSLSELLDSSFGINALEAELENRNRDLAVKKKMKEQADDLAKRKRAEEIRQKEAEAYFNGLSNKTKAGDPEAMIALSECYFRGYGVKLDVEAGLKLLTKAGTPKAIYEQAQIYINGKYGIPVDTVWGSELMSMAINCGYDPNGN